MRAVAVFVALVLLTAGCRAADESPSGGFSAEEVEWVGRYARWDAAFFRLLAREGAARSGVLGGGQALVRYKTVAADLRSCRPGLSRLPGAPPTARLRPTFAQLERLCEAVAVAVARLASAPGPSRTTAFGDVGTVVGQVVYGSQRVGQALDALSLARGPLPRIGGRMSRSRVEPVLSAVASRVAHGRSVEVRCWSERDWEHVLDEERALTNGALALDTVGAFALTVPGTLQLQSADCAPLVRLAAPGSSPDESGDVAYAVGLLSHEIQHVVGPDASEAETECAAVQRVAQVAQELGEARADALEIAERYWRDIHPTLDDEYRSGECRPGGRLDLAPGTPSWPTG